MPKLFDPPSAIVDLAVEVARASPCAKSKRGAVIYSMTHPAPEQWFTAAAHNAPPFSRHCAPDQPCRISGRCTAIAVHAEERALLKSINDISASLSDYGVVHVKVDSTGQLVAGGGPSCWQCARLILELAPRAVFLYQANAGGPPPAWVMYDPTEFYEATLRNPDTRWPT